MTELTNITVLGTGVLGSQIAFQTAYHGHPVVAYDISEEALAAAKERFLGLINTYEAEVEGAAGGKAQEAFDRIRLSADLADAVAEADLVIEAVPENPAIKQSTYEKLAAVAPEHTVFATNSSTLLPSDLMAATGRPDRFLALHFANRIWAMNTAEIMGTAQTDPEVYDRVVRFAEDIGMVPIAMKKEKAGYVLNSLLVPLLQAAGGLIAEGIADPETIDKTWRIGTGAPQGPMQIFDIIGLTTAYNVSMMGDETQQAFAKILKEDYIDQGKLGVATGEGFYRYQ
ncbi:3-hydroxyacyl-CoA dehydrogenase [Leucobacter sp. M11]|uniref:3-hydroxyacyl-CoA dehydrogenase n=1 Tax=Leucobacter sp. M11 TaxID=2993565 RepID=UPI002D808FDD|nr:3-hydroxyacyl-CoA dehydrogenase [Leucobacter sp. M11]MEB4616012.1 3-hydroxyacyl-CoA dehydrogenase [Leucobacter sp. M11]